MQTTGRLFYALWPDEAVIDHLVQLQAVLGGKKTHARDLHLTLAFLGAQPQERLPELIQVVHDCRFSPMALKLDCYGLFKRLALVWAGPSHIPHELFELRERLLEMPALAPLSFAREVNFVPHLTLARKASLPAQTRFKPIFWQASELVLAESTAQGQIPRYRILASCKV